MATPIQQGRPPTAKTPAWLLPIFACGALFLVLVMLGASEIAVNTTRDTAPRPTPTEVVIDVPPTPASTVASTTVTTAPPSAGPPPTR
jgi:hypothetical protein